MLNKEEAKERLKVLVKEFAEAEKYYSEKSEETIKKQFIEPLFQEVLGWDRKDFLMEERILKGRADYILKIGNSESLIIEAKRSGINLDDDDGRQAVSYAYHRKVKFAVLTNFKEITVYHALSKIKNVGKNLLRDSSGYFRIKFTNFFPVLLYGA